MGCPAALQAWGPLDREWATVPTEFAPPFVVFHARVRGQAQGPKPPCWAGNPRVWPVAPALAFGCSWTAVCSLSSPVVLGASLFRASVPPTVFVSLSVFPWHPTLSVFTLHPECFCLFGVLSQIWAGVALAPGAPVQPASGKRGV